jgi:curli biogenesis system outer membrane secretion channel CsgG
MTTSKKLSVLALAALMSAGVMTSSASFAGDHANSCNAKVKAESNACKANTCKTNSCKFMKKESNTCKTNTCKQKEANSCNGLKQSNFND